MGIFFLYKRVDGLVSLTVNTEHRLRNVAPILFMFIFFIIGTRVWAETPDKFMGGERYFLTLL